MRKLLAAVLGLVLLIGGVSILTEDLRPIKPPLVAEHGDAIKPPVQTAEHGDLKPPIWPS